MTLTKLQHIAIIMDGNRRWATERGMPKFLGHTEGAKNVERIAQAAMKAGVTHLTLWALSTENLKNREKKELKHLFSLIEKLQNYLKKLLRNNVRFNIIGDLNGLPQSTKDVLEKMVIETRDNTGLVLTFAINYGGRDDLVRAFKKIVRSGITEEDINESVISRYLDTADMPDPDLIIRTGGKQRVSNYMMWQLAYAELYFTDVYWPAFDAAEFKRAIDFFEGVQRNFGK